MKRILDIVLIAMIVFFMFSLFNKNTDTQKTGLNVGFVNTTYSIPAGVEIQAENYTDKTVTIDACSDFTILHAGTRLEFSEDFCAENSNIEVPSNTKKVISYSNVYDTFSLVGNYTLKANIGEKEFISNLELKHSGTFKKLFTGLVYAPIYNLVIWLVKLFSGSFGWAIVGVTFLIRILLLWPQHKMMVAQRRMQELQPKIKKIQDQYKDNKQELGIKIMDLYKKEKVNPLGSCGFLFIQMPILLVIYRIILGIKDPSNAFYLYPFLQKFDISKIDFSFFGMDLIASGGKQGIILAVTIALIQFVQIKLSMMYNKKTKDKKGVVLEKKKGDKDYSSMMPDPEMMNKVMLFGMPVMVAFFTYTLFAGIGIYWGISTLFMLFQQLIVNKMLKKSS